MPIQINATCDGCGRTIDAGAIDTPLQSSDEVFCQICQEKINAHRATLVAAMFGDLAEFKQTLREETNAN